MREAPPLHRGKLTQFIIGMFTRNLREKAVAFLLAFTAWYGVGMMVNRSTTISDIEVKITPPAGYIFMNDDAFKVALQVSGSVQSLENCSPKDFSLNYPVPYSDIPHQGDMLTLNLNKENIHGPYGIWIKEIRPASLRVKYDKVITQSKPVRIVTQGALKSDYTPTLTPIPASITITGPESIVGKMQDIPTDPIILDPSITEPFFKSNQRLKIMSNYVKADIKTVEVSVNIEKTGATRTLHSVPILIMQPQNLQHLQFIAEEPLVTDIQLAGNLDILRLVSNVHVRVYCDFSNVVINPEIMEYNVPVQCFCTEPSVTIKSFSKQFIRFRLVASE